MGREEAQAARQAQMPQSGMRSEEGHWGPLRARVEARLAQAPRGGVREADLRPSLIFKMTFRQRVLKFSARASMQLAMSAGRHVRGDRAMTFQISTLVFPSTFPSLHRGTGWQLVCQKSTRDKCLSVVFRNSQVPPPIFSGLRICGIQMVCRGTPPRGDSHA